MLIKEIKNIKTKQGVTLKAKVTKIEPAQSRKQKECTSITLQDSSGSLLTAIRDINAVDGWKENDVVEVTLQVSSDDNNNDEISYAIKSGRILENENPDAYDISEICDVPEAVFRHINELCARYNARFNDWDGLRRLCNCSSLNPEDIIRLIDMLDGENLLVVPFINYLDIECLLNIFETGKYTRESLYEYLHKCQTEQGLDRCDAISYLSKYISNCKHLNIEPDYFPSSLKEKENETSSMVQASFRNNYQGEFFHPYNSYYFKGENYQYEDDDFYLSFISDFEDLKICFDNIGRKGRPRIDKEFFYYHLVRKIDNRIRGIVLRTDSSVDFFIGCNTGSDITDEIKFVNSFSRRTHPEIDIELNIH